MHLFVERFAEGLVARADATPLVAGAKGSRYDLVLGTLYFRGRVPAPLSMAQAQELDASGLARAIPVLARNRARGAPVVGTTHDYYAFRGLHAARGTLPVMLGDCVLGAAVAARLGLGPGDRVLTDQENLYDLSRGYPLRMRVTGVLAGTGGPDDEAVLVDVKTAWVIEGIGHGHGAAAAQGADRVLASEGDTVVLNASVVEYNEITPENVESFHFHAEPEELPLTGVLVLPDDARAATILKGRYRVSKDVQLLEPRAVVDELLGFVLRIRAFFDANALLVSLSTALFLGVIVALSVQARRRELETLYKLGCSRARAAGILATELGLVVGAGALGALLLALFASGLARALLGLG